MMIKFQLFKTFVTVIIGVGILSSDCLGSTKTADSIQPIPTELNNPVTNSATPTPTPTEASAETPTFVLENPEEFPTHYQFEVDYNDRSHYASVNQTITYVNTLSEPLDFILLACDPLRTTGIFQLVDAQVNGFKNDVEIGSHWLRVELDDVLSQGEMVILDLSFTLTLPLIPEPADDRKPTIFGYTPLQTNFVDWYPMVVPRDGNGEWLLHDPWFYGEYLVYDLADFEIEIQLSDAVENTLIAASAVPYDDQANRYFYSLNRARNFVWSVSPSYLTSHTNVGDISITSYYFPFHQIAGEQVLKETAAAVQLFQEVFGAYPRNSLSIVEADFLDGMEYDGLYFLSRGFYNLYEGTPKGYLTMIAVHETAHQWWYTSVANDQAMQPWLDEALCTYSEFIFYENIYPDLADWWWSYRVDFYTPTGIIDLPIYEYHSFLQYRDAIYLNGAKFFHTLRTQTGEEYFFQILKKYQSEYREKISSAEDFWTIVEMISSVSRSEFDPEYFHTGQ